MAIDHARMKKALHAAKINLQSEQIGEDLSRKAEVSQESIAEALVTIKDYAAKMSPETLSQVSQVRREQLEQSAGYKMHKKSRSELERIVDNHNEAKERALLPSFKLTSEDTQELMEIDDSTDEGQQALKDLFDKHAAKELLNKEERAERRRGLSEFEKTIIGGPLSSLRREEDIPEEDEKVLPRTKKLAADLMELVDDGKVDLEEDLDELVELGFDSAAAAYCKLLMAKRTAAELASENPVTYKEASELAARMVADRLIPEDSLHSQTNELLALVRPAFDSMKRFVVARSTKPPTVDELKAAIAREEGDLSQEAEDIITKEAAKLARAMSRVGLIAKDSFEQQAKEMSKWSTASYKSMWDMVEKAGHPQPMVNSRNWRAGSDIANANHSRLVRGSTASLPPQSALVSESLDAVKKYMAQDTGVEKEVVINDPVPRRSIQEVVKEAHDKTSHSKPINLSSYKKRGSIKDRKEEADSKTTEEPAFIKELREARELLAKFDETFVDAKVEMMKAREAVLSEERNYDGSRLHEDTSSLHKLSKAHLSAQRNFAIIDKVYKQAFKKFEQIDVDQVTTEELNEVLKNYQATDEHTDLDAIFGGKYRTGDDNFYKWLARKKKFLSAEEAAEMFTDMVSNFPDEVADAFKKDKRSAGAVAPHSHEDASTRKLH